MQARTARLQAGQGAAATARRTAGEAGARQPCPGKPPRTSMPTSTHTHNVLLSLQAHLAHVSSGGQHFDRHLLHAVAQRLVHLCVCVEVCSRRAAGGWEGVGAAPRGPRRLPRCAHLRSRSAAAEAGRHTRGAPPHLAKAARAQAPVGTIGAFQNLDLCMARWVGGWMGGWTGGGSASKCKRVGRRAASACPQLPACRSPGLPRSTPPRPALPPPDQRG